MEQSKIIDTLETYHLPLAFEPYPGMAGEAGGGGKD